MGGGDEEGNELGGKYMRYGGGRWGGKWTRGESIREIKNRKEAKEGSGNKVQGKNTNGSYYFFNQIWCI